MNIMKPTIHLGAKNPQLAIYAHILALIGGVFSLIFGLLGLFSGSILGGIFSLLIAAIVVVVELDQVKVDMLKDALTRGIVWIILAVIGSATREFGNLVVAIAGILYLVYHYN